jgi:hypothetical protein
MYFLRVSIFSKIFCDFEIIILVYLFSNIFLNFLNVFTIIALNDIILIIWREKCLKVDMLV